MKGLVLKILRGNYPRIPDHYSENMRGLIADMLIKDPAKRPSIWKILEKEFLSKRISQLLSNTIAKHEFSNTFMKKHLTNPDEEVKEEGERVRGPSALDTEEGDTRKQTERSWVLKIKKDGTKRSEARFGLNPEDDWSDLDASVGKEKTPVLKEVEQNQKFRNYFKYKSSKKNTATRGDDKREMIKKSLHEDSKMDENFEENED